MPYSKWNETWTSYADPPKEDRKKTLNSDGVAERPSKEKIRNDETAKDRRDNENAEAPGNSNKPSERFTGCISNSDAFPAPSMSIGKGKLPETYLLQIFKQPIEIESERLKADETLLRATNENGGRGNIVNDGILSESCQGNTEEETSNQHTRIQWNLPRNRDAFQAALIPEVPRGMPTEPGSGFTKLLLKYALENSRPNHVLVNIGQVVSKDFFGLELMSLLPRIPNDRIV